VHVEADWTPTICDWRPTTLCFPRLSTTRLSTTRLSRASPAPNTRVVHASWGVMTCWLKLDPMCAVLSAGGIGFQPLTERRCLSTWTIPVAERPRSASQQCLATERLLQSAYCSTALTTERLLQSNLGQIEQSNSPVPMGALLPPELTRAHQSSPELTRAPQSSPDLARSHQSSPELTRAPQSSPELPRAHQSSPELTRAHQISPDLTRSHQISPELTVSHRISPYLAGSRQISPRLLSALHGMHATAGGCRRRSTVGMCPVLTRPLRRR
jgi:hypothetical protein